MPEKQLVSKIVVSIRRRKLVAYSKDQKLFEYDCVVGRPGHETLTGMFRIFKKEQMHFSRTYGNTPMPYSMFFSHDGKAIHGTPAAGLRSYAGYLGLGSIIPQVGSHGCVGLSNEQAKSLFDSTPNNTLVQIVN